MATSNLITNGSVKKEKPDMVVLFNFHNDYLRLFHNPKDNCSHLLSTAIGSEKILRNSWNKLSSKNYIFYDEYFQNIRSFFQLLIK